MRINRQTAIFLLLMISAPVSWGSDLTYVIGKYGIIRVPDAADSTIPALGILAGYRLDQHYAFELDVNAGLQGGSGVLPPTWTIGGYFAFRELLTRNLFWKTRIGSAFSRHVAEASDEHELRGAISLGIGAGWVFHIAKKTSILAESELTWLGGARGTATLGVSLPF